MSEASLSGPEAARSFAVWDPLVRLVHWSVAIIVLWNGWLNDPENDLHMYLGYLMVSLVATRLVWGLVGTVHARFRAFPPRPLAGLRHLSELTQPDSRPHLSHNPAGALMVYNLWATLLALGVTGYMMGTLAFFGVDWVKEVHEMAFNWLMASVVLHLGGVIIDSRRTKVHLVKAMLTGRKTLPEGATPQ